MSRGPRTDFLFARPSFWEGMARTVDLGGTLQEYNRTWHPDLVALQMDWRMVASDLNVALRRITSRLVARESNSPE